MTREAKVRSKNSSLNGATPKQKFGSRASYLALCLSTPAPSQLRFCGNFMHDVIVEILQRNYVCKVFGNHFKAEVALDNHDKIHEIQTVKFQGFFQIGIRYQFVCVHFKFFD